MKFRAISIILVGLVLILSSVLITEFLPDWRWAHHPFHAVIEGLGAFIAIVVATMILSLLHYDRLSPTYAWVASALAGMGILDGFHAGTHPGQEFVWFHSIATLIAGVILALVWIPERITESLQAKTLPLFIGAAATVFGIFSVIFPDVLPVMTTEAGFTLAARFANIFGGFCFLVASSFFFFRKREQITNENIILSNYCFLFGISGIIFEFPVLWDGSWWLWHGLRLIAYLIVLSYFLYLFNLTQATISRETKALKESEGRFKGFAEIASDWFWEMDRDLCFTYRSERYYEITEFYPKDKAGMRLMPYVDPSMPKDEKVKWVNHMTDLEARKPFKNFEFSFKAHDGKVISACINGVPIFDADQNFLGYRGTGTDVTRRKRAEEEIWKLSLAVEQSPSSVIITDTEGKIEYVNSKFTEVTGYTSEEAAGQNPRKLLQSDLTPLGTYEHLWKTVIAGGTWKGELYNKNKYGEFFWEATSVAPVKDSGGTVKYFVAVKEDITERKESEEALREKTGLIQLLQTISVAANEAATIDEAMQICVDTVCAHTGWPVGHVYMLAEGDAGEDLAPTKLWHLDHPEKFKTLRKITERTRFARGVGLPGRVLASGVPTWIPDVTKDASFLRAAEDIGVKAGLAFPVMVGTSVVAVLEFFSPDAAEPDEDLLESMRHVGTQLGRVVERARAMDDIRRLNEELEQRVVQRTAELAGANAELETFAYTVSHDLRAPLRSMDGFSHAVLEDYADKLDAEGRDYLERIRRSSRHMAQLIDDILILSRVTRSEFVRNKVDLSAIAEAIAAELRDKDPVRDVSFDIAPRVVADGDGRLLRIVLENLLGNAWKFTSKHPKATITFGVTETNGEPAYYVRDDGAGFDMAYADKLFQPFQRLHLTQDFEGTGIGLATVERIVRRHGGRAWAESTVEGGATTSFTLST